jgi:hypothetical protein
MEREAIEKALSALEFSFLARRRPGILGNLGSRVYAEITGRTREASSRERSGHEHEEALRD